MSINEESAMIPEPGDDVLAEGGEPRRHRWGRPIVLIASVTALAAVGVGVAYAAADPSGSPSPSPTESAKAAPGGPHGHLGGGPRFAPWGGPGGALHGEFVVPKSGGGYQTVDTQHGKVTAVSKDSITVRSDDGYSKSYAVTSDTMVNADRDGISAVKNGDDVAVTATVSGGKATATTIVDLTQAKANMKKWAPPAPRQPGPEPSGTATPDGYFRFHPMPRGGGAPA
ncbi:MAG: hypothetical protein ACJ73S_16540 [Mycobacteriales bacterium]